MAAVAERLVGGAAAAAQARAGDAIDGAARAGTQLQVASNQQRAVALRANVEHAAARGERFRRACRGFARGREPDAGVAAVAVRLVLRGAAATQRGAITSRFAVELQLGAEAERTVLSQLEQVDGRRALVLAAVLAHVTDRARGTQ